jgi:hypothetical protein
MQIWQERKGYSADWHIEILAGGALGFCVDTTHGIRGLWLAQNDFENKNRAGSLPVICVSAFA